MKQFFIWMQKDEGWKSICVVVYAVICIFDFIIIPTWMGISRATMEPDNLITEQIFVKLDPSVQIRIIDGQIVQHNPLTLQGGGMFHLAFGALLTGSALAKRKNNDNI